MKKIAAFLMIIAASSILTARSLETALHKEFWEDEILEVHACLLAPVSTMFLDGVNATPSPSPLHFALERELLGAILSKERADGQGFDWRVSFRVLPAFSLGIGAIIAALLLSPVSWIASLSLPILLGNMNFLIWYGAETRIYALWAACSLIFYVLALRLALEPRRRLWLVTWVLFAGVMELVGISSLPMTLFATSALGLALYFKKQLHRETIVSFALSCALSFSIYFLYRKHAGSPMPGTTGYSWHHFRVEGLRAFPNIKGALEYLALSSLLAASSKQKYFKFRLGDFYGKCGMLGLSQLALLLLLYFAEYWAGYWWAPRHGIFICAMNALVRASCVALLVELLESAYKAFPKPLRVGTIALTVFLICYLDWFQHKVLHLNHALSELRGAWKPYCHVELNIPKEPRHEWRTKVPDAAFIALNELRHSGKCDVPPPAQDQMRYTFSPSWAYGTPLTEAVWVPSWMNMQ